MVYEQQVCPKCGTQTFKLYIGGIMDYNKEIIECANEECDFEVRRK